jgi:hypothetical protein
MDIGRRLDEIADVVTEGLKDDPVLRLDVRSEILSHLLDKVDEIVETEGKPREEAIELAIKSLGPVPELAEDIWSANRKRMRFDALVKWGIRVALVPAAVLTALLATLPGLLMTGMLAVELFSPSYDGSSFGKHLNILLNVIGRGSLQLSKEKVFLIYGDRRRPTTPEQQRAIWEKNPENRVYYGNYISYLADGGGTGLNDMDRFEEEIRRGEQLDPENSRYNYLLAGMFLKHAGEYRRESISVNESFTSHYIVKDRSLLDRAMDEALKGLKKPGYKRYATEMRIERLDGLPEDRHLDERFAKAGIAVGVSLPDSLHIQHITLIAPHYAELMLAEGKKERAREVMHLWKDLTAKLINDSYKLTDILIALFAAKVSLNDTVYARAYEKIGDPSFAAASQKSARQLSDLFTAWLARNKQNNEKRNNVSAGMLTRIFLPAFGKSPDPEDLRAGRLLEYTLLEQSWTGVTAIVLLLFMAGAGIVTLRWRLFPGEGGGSPLLLLPDRKTAFRIFILGVVLPIATFFVYTRIAGLGGREISVWASWPQAAAELCMLGAAIVGSTLFLASRAVRRKCRSLDVPMPPSSGFWKWTFLALACASIVPWILHFLVHEDVATAALLIWAILVLLAGMSQLPRTLLGKSRYGLYKGSIARSIVPVCAIALILLAAVTSPYLNREEARLLKVYSITSFDKGKAGFTNSEIRVIEELKTRTQETFRR